MRTNFEQSLSRVLTHEGGFSNHPRDPGGATNKGITIATFRRYVKRNGTVENLRNITDAQVAEVYRKQYWHKVRGDDLPSGVDYAVFDFAVNSGPSRAAKFLQRLLGVSVDGKIGPDTLTAIHSMSPDRIIIGLCDNRFAWLEGLRTFSTFGRGWTRRVNEVKRDAVGLVNIVKAPQPDDPTDGQSVAKNATPGPSYKLLRAIFEMLKHFFK